MSVTIVREGRPNGTAGPRGMLPGLPAAVETVLGVRTADAVFAVAPDGRVVHWDARTEILTGFLAGEVIGRPCHAVLRGEYEGGGRMYGPGCPVLALARAGHAVPGYDARIETKLFGKRWVSVGVLCVDSEEGTYLVNLLRDARATRDALEVARAVTRPWSPEGAHTPGREQSKPELTPRQAQVLALLAAGRTAREIGRELFLSQATVRNHIRALLLALGAHSQLEVLAKAREAGLLPG